MKNQFFRIFSASFAVFAGLAMAPMQAQAVNVSIGVGGEVLPGVYGSVNIDNGRYPTLVYDEPLIVTRASRIYSPAYLHVPPGHLKKWGKYCDLYDACSRPVYFAKSRDYYDFSPRYIEQRYVYRDRVTYVNRGGYDRSDYYDRREYRHHHHDRRDNHSGGYDRKHWKNEDQGNGKPGRGRHD